MSESSKTPLLPIFLTIFLDMLGIGIIIPVLPALFLSPETSILAADTSQAQRSMLYGYLIAIYPFMQFFGAPALGALSDRYGRRPMLLISLIGTLVGYLLFGWAILRKDLLLLFISRALPGFTGGNVSIIYSAISDITSDKQELRPRYFGFIGMAFGLGFILGPAIGGILADSNISSWFNHATPFWFTAGLTALNILLLLKNFPETNLHPRQSSVSFFTGLLNVRRAFTSPNLKGIFTVSLLLSLSFSFFTQFFSVYLLQRFGMKEKEIGLIFGWIGIWLVITQAIVVRKLSQKIASTVILRYSLILLAIAMPSILLAQNLWQILLINPFVALFQGLSSPNLTTVVSSFAQKQEQGEVLGINQSMVSVGQMIPPVIAGYLNSINGSLPILTSGFTLVLGWIVYLSLRKRT